MSFIVGWHYGGRGSGSLCKLLFSIRNRYGEVDEYLGACIENSSFKEEPSLGIQYSLRISAYWQLLHKYTLRNLVLAVATAAPCTPIQCLVPVSPLEMLATFTPSSPVWTLTLRKNVQTTCLLAGRSSQSLAASYCMYVLQRPSERASCPPVIEEHSQGIPDCLTGPLPPLPLTLQLHSQKSNALQVDPRIPGLVSWQLQSISSSHSVFTEAATILYEYADEANHVLVTLNWDSNIQTLTIPGWGYDTSIELLCGF